MSSSLTKPGPRAAADECRMPAGKPVMSTRREVGKNFHRLRQIRGNTAVGVWFMHFLSFILELRMKSGGGFNLCFFFISKIGGR